MGKIYYDEYGRPVVRERNGIKTVLIIIVLAVTALMFADSRGLVNLSQYLPNEKQPVIMAVEPTAVQQVQPTPNMVETAVGELTRTAPEAIPPAQVIEPTAEPAPTIAPTIVPTGSSVEPDTDVIIITDGNGYPVYAGPLTQDQWQQCKDISESGNFWRLVDYQKPICMSALQ